MLLLDNYAGYTRGEVIELKEKEYIDIYEDGNKVKELNANQKIYLNVLIRLCNWLTTNARYEESYAEWVITTEGINVRPHAIVFDDKNDKITMDAELFSGIIMEGIISKQIKEIKKGMINLKQLIKDNNLNNIIDIKPAIVYWDDDDCKPRKNNNATVKTKYFSKKIPIIRFTLTKSKIKDEMIGFLMLMGSENHIFDNVNKSIYDFAYICKVK